MTTSPLPPLVAVLVGAGPRGLGLLERLTTHASRLLAGRRLELHVVDPYPFGAGRIWHAERPSAWRLDHPDDVTVLADGPGLAGWTSRPDAAPVRVHRLAHYLTWAFWRTVRTAPDGVVIRTHRATAIDLTDEPDGRQRVRLQPGASITADLVLLAQGLPGTRPTAEQRDRARFAEWHGLRYFRPSGGEAPDLGAVPAGVDVLVRDVGPVAGDQVTLLLEGRGGRYLPGEGSRLVYRPSGAEPRIHLLAPDRPEWTHEASRPDGDAWHTRRDALLRAGIAIAHSPTAQLELDPVRGAFLLGGAGRQLPSRTLIEPDAGTGTVRRSADPLLGRLAERGELAGWSGTGAHLDRGGRAHPRRFSVGALPGSYRALAAVTGADPLADGPLAENDRVARALLILLAGLPTPAAAAPRPLGRLEVRRGTLDDPDVASMFADLTEEYAGRYGHRNDLFAIPEDSFAPPHGALLVLREDGVAVAGGAFKQRDVETAELKRIWTHSDHRRRGLARRVLVELEREAARRGYRRVHLTTGPRQPEARRLYLSAGYTPEFDPGVDPESIGKLAFGKVLVPAPRGAAEHRTPSPPRRRSRPRVGSEPAGLPES